MCLRVERRHCWWRIGIGLVRLLDDVVRRLKEEEVGALVASDIGLVAVITEPLLSAFRHLVRR
jgi:hypothetical protein